MNEYRGIPLSRKAYLLYLGLKLHFGYNYDFIKYKGKIPVSKEKLFIKEKEMYWIKLSRHDDPFGLLLANLSYDYNMWIGDILSTDGQDRYLKQQHVLQSLTYIFEQDIKNISLDDLKITKSTKFPNILNLSNNKTISYETCIILIDILELLHQWDEIYKDNLIWEPIRNKIVKYTPFVQYDKDKIINLIEKYWNKENAESF